MKNMNYYNTFIEVASDCPVSASETPKQKANEKTIPFLQYEMIANHPYEYTQEDILFEVYAIRNQIPKNKKSEEREKFFSKSQACLRASSLGKRYGWGIHNDENGKLALYGVETKEYKKFLESKKLDHVKAMSSKRAKRL